MSPRFALVFGVLLSLVPQFVAQTDPKPISVGLCEVVTSPEVYNEKLLLVEGVLHSGEHSLVLYNPACKPKEGFNVSIQAVLPPEFDSLRNGKRLGQILKRSKEARVTLMGIFKSEDRRYGHDVAQFRFSVAEITAVDKAAKAKSP